MQNIHLETKTVGDIKGEFIVPSYQRGYRWGEKDVERLVNDILNNGPAPYCLQPIVVKKLGSKPDGTIQYELIDGQQRLTTLYLIYQYIHENSFGFLPEPAFSIEYKTRPESAEFLTNIDKSRSNENIDFWYMSKAYEKLNKLLAAKDKMTDINKYLAQNVNIIWYEVPTSEDGVSLFQRLNIGKIQLTASELVKALFLRDTPEDSVKEYQEEIALQWDNMERDLHDDDLWAFLTNKKTPKYATRIDLVLDLMAGKGENERDSLSTFFYFDNLAKSKRLYDVWKDIQKAFLQLKDWRYDHDLYHKIGYLIASESATLLDIYNDSKEVRKSEFKQRVDNKIRESLRKNDQPVDIEDLQYGKDNELIKRILLLFNVESVRTIDNEVQWFPFSKHKDGFWSLEHIHAQRSEGLNANSDRYKWLTAHISSLKGIIADLSEDDTRKAEIMDSVNEAEELVKVIESKSKKNIGNDFKTLQEKIVGQLSPKGETDTLHSIDNLALLDVSDNAALSNYVFDAKRNIIIDLDKQGRYIPYCTKMVFFKYYTPSDHVQVHFWGPEDRKAYEANIKTKLAYYLN